MRRVLAYHMPSEAEQKSAERKLLEGQLNIAIRAALEHEGNTNTSPTIPAIPAVENQRPNRIIVVRREKAVIHSGRVNPARELVRSTR